MTGSIDFAYTYGRICGGLAKSVFPSKFAVLARCKNMADAWRIAFNEEAPHLPDRALFTMAETRLAKSAVESLRAIVGSLVFTEPVFIALSNSREIAFVKRIVAAALSGRDLPCVSLGSDSKLRQFIEEYPDIPRMVEGTPYRWIAQSKDLGLHEIKLALDRQYFKGFFEHDTEISFFGRENCITNLVSKEVELLNIIWALRLKLYYAMEIDDIRKLLIDVPCGNVKAAAVEALAFRWNVRNDWRNWKWNHLVPDTRSEGSGTWSLDIGELETVAKAYFYHQLIRSLHHQNDTIVSLYAYFKIKEIESSILSGILEGIAFAAPENEITQYAFKIRGDIV
jgi:hypothetical protein